MEHVYSLSEVMTFFLNALFEFGNKSSTKQRNYFLQHLNLFFKEYYREYMNINQQKYVQMRKMLAEFSD